MRYLLIVLLAGCGPAMDVAMTNGGGMAHGQLTARPIGSLPMPDMTPAGPSMIWPLGDSLTHGSLQQPGGVYIDSGGYRVTLWSMAAQDGKQIGFVGTQNDGPWAPMLPDGHNDGHPGYKAADILAQLPAWMGAVGRYDVAVILVGTNSIYHGFYSDHYAADGVTLDPGYPVAGVWTTNDGAQARHQAAVQIETVVQDVEANMPDCVLVVMTLPPIWTSDGAGLGYQKTLALVNAELQHEWSYDHRLRVVDLFSAITRSDLGADGLHFTADGYAKVGALVYSAL